MARTVEASRGSSVNLFKGHTTSSIHGEILPRQRGARTAWVASPRAALETGLCGDSVVKPLCLHQPRAADTHGGLQVGAGRQLRRAIYPGIPTSSGQTCGVRLDPGRPRHSLLHPTSRRRYSRRHDASRNLVVRCPHHPRPRSPSGRGRDRDGQRPRVEFVGQLGPRKAWPEQAVDVEAYQARRRRNRSTAPPEPRHGVARAPASRPPTLQTPVRYPRARRRRAQTLMTQHSRSAGLRFRSPTVSARSASGQVRRASSSPMRATATTEGPVIDLAVNSSKGPAVAGSAEHAHEGDLDANPRRLCPTIERGSLPRATDQTALQSSRSGRQVTRVSLGLQLAQRLDCP